MSMSENPLPVWGSGASNLRSAVVSLTLGDGKGNDLEIKDTEEDIIIEVDIDPANVPEPVEFSPFVRRDATWDNTHVINVANNNSAIYLVLRPDSDNATFEVLIRYGDRADDVNYDLAFQIPRNLSEEDLDDLSPENEDEMTYSIFVSPDFIEYHGTGDYYVRVKQQVNFSLETDDYYEEPSVPTTLSPIADEEVDIFSMDDDFFVPPNTIDFGSIYDNLGAKLKDNFAVLVTICVLLALYILVGIWARYKDKQDVKKWGVTALADNLAGEKYLYLLTVVTGMKGKSGTASNISFVLSGTDDDTGVRKLSDDKRKEHTRGSSVQYVMSTEGPLGHPTYLRIWHDNSGKNDKAGWYLDRFTVSDLQTGKTFAFIVNRWLAVDEDDGQIDRLVPVATPEDITAFRNLFVNTSKKNLTDGHLWVSIFVRPYKSTYTRVQRLSVVVSVTFLTMVVNAMFYKSEPVRTTKLELGFMTVTTFQLWVSIMGTLIVIPPSVAMDQIFRKCRPRPSKTDALLQKVAQAEDGKIVNRLDSDEGDPSDQDSADKKKKKKPISLPWWCVFFAWLLVAGAIGVSAFMVFSYSIQWGKEKANSWLTAMLLSIFQSVVIVQPAKVFVLAAILAIVLKKPDVEDLDDEERKVNGSSANDEELDVDKPQSGSREKIAIQPIDPKKLERIRRKRLAEREMLTLIKEMLIYVVYLFFLLFLAQQNRNSNAFLVNKNLKNLFIDYDVESNEMFQTPADVFGYMRDTFLPSVFWTELYNGEEINLRDKPFMADGVSFRIGAVRLRQVRIKPGRFQEQNDERGFQPDLGAWMGNGAGIKLEGSSEEVCLEYCEGLE
ncbi:polycystin-1-like protein 2 [Macrobrachium nipponense]|uniref:polycystin-1-like protein 2 n=1 Tax=Macrobrachium nipponense TaxID=159736 RepID=UPI0030C8CBAE